MVHVLLKLPLVGQLVALSRFEVGHLDSRYLSWLNDPEVLRYSNQRFLKHTYESSLQYLRSFDESENYFLSVRRRSDGQPIGTMTAYVSRQHGTADVGVMIGERAAWGHGYGRDAWTTLIGELLRAPGIRKVTGGTLDCNIGMLRLMVDSGMQPDGVRKAQELVDGEPHDIRYYARFRDD